MAKKAAKSKAYKPRLKASTSGVHSVALEEEIPVPYWVVGTRDWLDGWFEPDALPEDKTLVVSSPGDLADVKHYLAAQPQHILDSETGTTVTDSDGEFDKKWGMEPWHPKSQMLMWQYGTAERPYIIEPALVEEFRPFLEGDEWLKILQNAVFDFKFFLAKHDVHLVRLACTMLTEQLLTAGRSGLRVNLLELARRYLPYRIIRKDIRDQFVGFKIGRQKFTRDMCYYAGRDIVLPPDIFKGQLQAIKQWKLEDTAQVEFNAIPCTAEMELHGVYIAIEVLKLALSFYDERDKELWDQILNLVGETIESEGKAGLGLFGKEGFYFDIRSSQERMRIVSDVLGFSVDNVTRETMMNLPHEVGPLLGEWTGVEKIRTTYGAGLINNISPYDGRLHPRFSQLGMGDMEARAGHKDTIATGRYSSNFQQLPKPVERYTRVKDLGELHIAENAFAAQLAQIRQERNLHVA